LKDDVSAIRIANMEDELAAIPHVIRVTYKSKEDALKEWSERNKAINLEDLQMENPLPNSYTVKVDKPANIEMVADQIELMDGMLPPRYGSKALKDYIKVLMILSLICLVTITLLILFTYSSINNIIALSIYARRAEIRIMQLVGATWWFIRWPFLFEGIFFGVTGAAIALAIIIGVIMGMGEALKLSELSLALPNLAINQVSMLTGLGLLLIGLGLIVGFFGSLRTVNTFLQRESAASLGPAKRAAVG
jgi:cell division transport system permease protein